MSHGTTTDKQHEKWKMLGLEHNQQGIKDWSKEDRKPFEGWKVELANPELIV